MPPLPKYTQSTVRALAAVNRNDASPESTRVLASRIKALEKKNKKVALIFKLLAGGAVAAAVAYAGYIHYPLAKSLVATAAQSSIDLKNSVTVQGRALYNRGKTLGRAVLSKLKLRRTIPLPAGFVNKPLRKMSMDYRYKPNNKTMTTWKGARKLHKYYTGKNATF